MHECHVFKSQSSRSGDSGYVSTPIGRVCYSYHRYLERILISLTWVPRQKMPYQLCMQKDASKIRTPLNPRC
ncbi:hypothetical protein POX_h09873 [Penicillium oxalicum]|uniref:Uncharacterized protein n=1 Tax=Penicillium oxalicum (strain 114-2 / CGMCC 5302) TaxID=933388 RepID=S7ZML5_PENO1|nr:hypothetical protein POX_h09873 [Penicillium oxalicum]EPS31599.1 hypothetical protein PDE_06554 [Penicillium oxalicum 114-2]KAI2786106.1 hypothetical protein POX_h09873 [Penicillium oxalicum]